MKAVVILCVALFAAVSASELKCTRGHVDGFPTEWIDMVPPCIKQMRQQVQEELKASMTYMAMGAFFSRAIQNRPGFAKFFFDSANEEREHAGKLIAYLLNRGELTSEVSSLIDVKVMPKQTEWTDGMDALKSALRLEADVTKKIRKVIEVCEDPSTENDTKQTSTPGAKPYNDYELVDYLTGEFLTEQYKGQRELAGKISVLGKMMKDHKELGEFLFDKTLL